MSDDIVTRLRGKEHGDDDRRCESCDSFCCHCELCDCCLEILEVCLDAADEIERLRAKYDRLLNHIQLVAQSPDSRLARDILRYYYPLSQNGVGTSITLKWVDDEAVRDD